MTEHVHEWNIPGTPAMFVITCSRVDCVEELTLDEAEARLNATEALSAEHARYLLHQYKLFAEKLAGYTKGWEPLRTYANTLEGK